jgi:hypothetical protein
VSQLRRAPAFLLLGSLLLVAAWGSADLTRTAWQRLASFNPPPVNAPVALVPAGRTERLVLIAVEGLGPDEASLLPTLHWLAERGARFALSAEEPLTPQATLATLLTGAPPSLTGTILPDRPVPLGAETLLKAAQRGNVGATALGTPLAGRLLGTGTNPLPTNPAARTEALKGAIQGGGKLSILVLDDLQQAARALGTADPARPEYRQKLAELDSLLLSLFDSLDLNKTTLVLTGYLPTGPDGTHRPTDRGLLLAVGPGVEPGARGEAALTDVAPTVAVLLGLPIPAHATGAPILALLDERGRQVDAVAAQVAQVRRSALQGALEQMGATDVLPEAPTTAEAAQPYLAAAAKYVAEMERYLRLSRWQERAPWAGGALILTLIYLIALAAQPFGAAVFRGALVYLVTLPALVLLTGGRYAYLGGGLTEWGQVAVLKLAGLGILAGLVAAVWTGYRLSRQGFKRGEYLAMAGFHLCLLLVLLGGLPLEIGWALWGDGLPVQLPGVLPLALILGLGGVITLLGLTAPLIAFMTTLASRVASQVWPLPEVGDPEENADKVVRLRAIKRSTQAPRRAKRG